MGDGIKMQTKMANDKMIEIDGKNFFVEYNELRERMTITVITTKGIVTFGISNWVDKVYVNTTGKVGKRKKGDHGVTGMFVTSKPS